uniref:putative barnase/colicin E5 family endoribonuclease n=1 Tax=Helicobacter equorum TaxID=361872 RepID=UPI002279E456
MQDTKSDLEELITPTFFKEGKPLSQADIYDFIENLITKGEASANTSKVIDLLPELRNKERAYNAFNNQSTQTKEPQQLLVSKENLHTEPKAQEPNPFTTPTPKQATKASEQSQEPNLFTAQDPAAPKQPVQEAQTQAPQTREQIKARLAQEEKEAITQLRSELLADYNQKVAQIKANKKLSEAKQQEKIKDLQAKNNSLFMRKSNEIHREFEQKATQALQDLQSLENTKKIDRVDEFADRFFLSYERDKAIALNNRYNEIIESSEFKEATQRHTQLSEKELDEIAIHFARYSKENEKFSDDAIKTFAQELAQELSQTQKSFNMLDFKDSILTDKQIVGNSRKQKQFLENKRQKIQRHLNITPIKEFGTNYAEFYKDGTGAIGKILAESKDYEARKKAGSLSQKEREQGAYKGQVAGAFYKEGLGDIDVVWGDSKMGLQKIIDKHIDDFNDFAGETQQAKLANGLSEIVENGKVVSENGVNTIIYTKDNNIYRVGLSKGWDKQGDNEWIITAYKVDRKSPHSDVLPSNEITKSDGTNLHSNDLNNSTIKTQRLQTQDIKFIDTKGKEHTLSKDTQKQWLQTFGLQNLEQSYIPKHSQEIQQALGGKEIKLQKGSLLKLVSQGREQYIPQIKEVLDNPEAIIRDKVGDYLLLKHLKDDDYFVNVSFDNGEYLVSISNGFKETNNLQNKLKNGGEIIYQSPNANSILQTLLQTSRYSANTIDSSNSIIKEQSKQHKGQEELKNVFDEFEQ